MPARPHRDVTAGIALLAFCALGYWLTLGFAEVPPMLAQNVPPTFFPRLILGVMALLSLVLIVSGARKSAAGAERIHARVLVTALAIVAAGVFVTVLGTLITLALVALALPLLWGERRYLALALFAIGLPAAVYVLFTRVLDVRFPPGPLAGLFG